MSTVNVAEWEPQQRRTGSLVAIGIAVLLVLVGVAVWWFADASDAVYWTLVVLLALVLVFVVLVLVLGMRAELAEREPIGDAHAGPASPGILPPPAAATSANISTLSLRCGDCGTVFDVTDTGERPLYHTCPGCGAEGVLRAPAGPAEPEPAPAPAAQPDSVWAAPPEREEAPAEVAPPPPTPAAPRRLKLRCGGCKEVFVIEDTGERPLRRPCPHCSRMGEIR